MLEVKGQEGQVTGEKKARDAVEYSSLVNIADVDLASYERHLKQADELLQKGYNNEAEKYYAKAFKVVQGKQYTAKQIHCLKGLGFVYLAREEYTKAVALYNAALVRSEPSNKKEFVLYCKLTEYLFLASIKPNTEVEVSKPELDIAHKERLHVLRKRCEKEIEKLDKWWEEQRSKYKDEESLVEDHQLWYERAQRIKKIYEDIEAEYKAFIVDLFKECQTILGPEPCKYAVVGLGSMARGEITPYSDFEWMILIEDEVEKVKEEYKDKDDGKAESKGTERDRQYDLELAEARKKQESYKPYFRNLTKLLHIKILNLGETVLPCMVIDSLNPAYPMNPGYDWYFDDITPNGIKFDGFMPRASKTPLGTTVASGLPEGETAPNGKTVFELIHTPQEMAMFQGEQWYNEDHLLPGEMATFCFIKGDEELVHSYRLIITNKLYPGHKVNSSSGRNRALCTLAEDVSKFKLTLEGSEEEGKLYVVKKEIYRVLDRMIDGLAFCYGLQLNSCWDRIDELYTKNVIIKAARDNLRIAASIAIELRLRAYLKNKGQYENMSAFAPLVVAKEEQQQKQINEAFSLPESNRNTKSILFKFYYTALPLTESVEELILEQDKDKRIEFEEFFKERSFLDKSPLVRARIHIRLMQYRDAINILEPLVRDTILSLPNMTDGWQRSDAKHLISLCANAFMRLGMFDKQLACLKAIEDADQAEEKGPRLLVINTHQGPRKKEELVRKIMQGELRNKGVRFNNKGIALGGRKDYQGAKNAFLNALSIYRQDEEFNRLNIAQTTYALGAVYLEEDASIPSDECRQTAKVYLQEALAMSYILAGSIETDLLKAMCLSAWGAILLFEKQYEQSKEHFVKALQIFEKYYGEIHPYILKVKNYLISIYSALGLYEQAERGYRDVIKIFEHIHQTTNLPECASLFHNLGNALIGLGKYEQAEKVLLKTRDIYINVCGFEIAHESVVITTGDLIRAVVRQGNKIILQDQRSALSVESNIKLGNYTSYAIFIPPIAKQHYHRAIKYKDEWKVDEDILRDQVRASLFDMCFQNASNNDKLGEAIEHCQVAVILFPGNTNFKTELSRLKTQHDMEIGALAQEGNKSFIAKNYNTAIEFFTRAINLSYNCKLELYYNRGRAHHQSNNLLRATIDYQMVLDKEPAHLKTILNVGDCYKRKVDILKAEECFINVMRINSNHELADRAKAKLDEINHGRKHAAFKSWRSLVQGRKVDSGSLSARTI